VKTLLLLSLLVLTSCASLDSHAALEAGNIALAAAYSEADGGHALLVMQDGEVVYEAYQNGWDPAEPHRIASGTKSFWGLLAVCAAEDGLLDLDELAADTLEEWRDDARKSRITVRQLLSFTSGLEPALAHARADVGGTDLYAKAVTMGAAEEPGAGWAYGGTNHAVFGEIMRRKLAPRGETVESYLFQRLLDPIGLVAGAWTRDGAGDLLMSSGAHLTAREWAKLGELVRRGGVGPGGRRVVAADLLAEVFRGSDVFPIYGLSWWLATTDQERIDMPRDFVMAAGAGKQYLYVIPSLGLTIVRQGESETYANAEFFARLLRGASVEEYERSRALAAPK